MEKIIRSTAVSGNRKLTGEGNPAAAKRAEERPFPRAGTQERVDAKSITTKAAGNHSAYPENNQAIDQTLNRAVIENLKQETEKLRQQCEQANRRYEETARELAELQRENQQQAWSKGYEEGKEAGQKLWTEKLQAFDKLIADISTYVEDEMANLEKTAVEIAFTALCRIIDNKASDKEFVVNTVKNVLAQVKADLPVNLHVSNRHLDVLQQYRGEIEAVVSPHPLNIVADSRVTLGGCILQTEAGSWDGRLETQLQRLKEALVAADKAGSFAG